MALVIIHMDDSTHLIAEIREGNDPIGLTLGMTGVIRQWGTTKGRGELADGPTSKTIVDWEPEGGQVNWMHVRRIIPVRTEGEEKWRAHYRTYLSR